MQRSINLLNTYCLPLAALICVLWAMAAPVFAQETIPLPGQSRFEVVVCPPGVLVAGAVPVDRVGCEVSQIDRSTPACYAAKARALRTQGFELVATAIGTAADINGLIGGVVETTCIDGPAIPNAVPIPPLPTALPADICERMMIYLVGKDVEPDGPEINALFGEEVCPVAVSGSSGG